MTRWIVKYKKPKEVSIPFDFFYETKENRKAADARAKQLRENGREGVKVRKQK